MRLATLSLLLVTLVGSAMGQGSASAAGGGMGGGGFGGVAGAPGNRNARDAEDRFDKRPEADNDSSFWTSKRAILTPGDRVEFKFKLDKGQVLLASVDSDAFDPGLSIEKGGKVLLKNDDREEGDQAPLLNFRAPEDGEYLLKVLSYRSVSGGQFTARFRTITPVDFDINESAKRTIPEDRNRGRIVVRLPFEKGKVYDIWGLGSPEPNSFLSAPILKVIGPTGVPKQDFEAIIADQNARLFKAKATGDYLIEFASYAGPEQRGEFRLVQQYTLKPEEPMKVPLGLGERAIIEWPVKKGTILRTSIAAEQQMIAGSMGEIAESDESTGASDGWCWFQTNVDSRSDMVRSFTKDGTYRMVLRSLHNGRKDFEVRNTAAIPEWKSGVPIEEQLKIGDSPIFIYRSSKSELVRVSAAGGNFLPILQIYTVDGSLANSLSDRKKLTVGDDLYFPNAGTFIIRFACVGDGGSGAYSLKRDVLGATAYSLGASSEALLGGPNLALYSVKLEAGKQYELVEARTGGAHRVDLLDFEGEFLNPQVLGFDGSIVRYFKPSRSGEHRLWFRGGNGAVKYILREFKPPSADGG